MEINKIYHQDCFEGMEQMIKEGVKVDLIVTDPPYLFERGGKGKSKLGQRAGKLNESIDFISKDFDFEKCFEMFLQLQDIPNMLIFCSNRQLSRTMQFFENKGLRVTCLVWHKTNPIPLTNNTYMKDIEFVIRVNGEGATFNNDCPFDYKKKVYTSGIVPTHDRLHPTQKDLKHICRFVELHSNEGDLVLDAFMGSGTTAIACIKNKRNFIGFELSDEFYKVATKRVENEQANLTLF